MGSTGFIMEIAISQKPEVGRRKLISIILNSGIMLKTLLFPSFQKAQYPNISVFGLFQVAFIKPACGRQVHGRINKCNNMKHAC